AAISASRMYMSGDEADAARLLGAQLDVGQVRGGDDVRAALGIEGQVGGVLLQCGRDLRAHLFGGGGGAEGQLSTGVDDADADFHAISSVSADTGNSTGRAARPARHERDFAVGAQLCRPAPLAWRT